MSERKIEVPISLSPGDRIKHIKFGHGVVVSGPDDHTVGIRFDSGLGVRKLVADGRYLMHGDNASHWRDVDPFQHDKDEWRHSVFEYETDAVEHDTVTLWGPVFPERAELFKYVPDLLADTPVTWGISEFYAPPRGEPATWQKALIKDSGDRIGGALFTIALDADANRIVQLSPCVPSLAQHNIEIDKVRVWANSVNALIDCRIDDSSLTFFDNHFAVNRGWYYPGAHFSFLIGALAISCKVGIEKIQLNFNEEQRERWEASHALIRERGYPDAEAPTGFSLANAAVYLHDASPDQDYAQYRGRLSKVLEIEFMGHRAWQTSIVFLRSLNNEDAPMTMVITSLAWAHDFPPKVGMDVEGLLWLQGRMWHRQWTYTGVKALILARLSGHFCPGKPAKWRSTFCHYLMLHTHHR